jgi:hypothetical protein
MVLEKLVINISNDNEKNHPSCWTDHFFNKFSGDTEGTEPKKSEHDTKN